MSEPSNETRAEWALAAISELSSLAASGGPEATPEEHLEWTNHTLDVFAHISQARGEPTEALVQDLLCNLMHACALNDTDFAQALVLSENPAVPREREVDEEMVALLRNLIRLCTAEEIAFDRLLQTARTLFDMECDLSEELC